MGAYEFKAGHHLINNFGLLDVPAVIHHGSGQDLDRVSYTRLPVKASGFAAFVPASDMPVTARCSDLPAGLN